MIKLKDILLNKVVNEQDKNNILTVYHGTDIGFKKFNIKKSAQGIIWFTSDKDKILKGEVGASGKGFIITAQVTINNPAGWDEYDKYLLIQLQQMGYDGVILKNNDESFDCFVFDTKQIKIVKIENIKDDKINELDIVDQGFLRAKKVK